MMLAAGATTPPVVDGDYTYTYNIITFDWHSDSEGLGVTIRPRTWNHKKTCFEGDETRLGGRDPYSVLSCPNYRKAQKGTDGREAENPKTDHVVQTTTEPADMPDNFQLTLLRFFRDLTPKQRLSVLIKLRALPEAWRDTLTHAMERHVVDSLESAGRLGELSKAIDYVQADIQGSQENT
jgi:hypothetical protein